MNYNYDTAQSIDFTNYFCRHSTTVYYESKDHGTYDYWKSGHGTNQYSGDKIYTVFNYVYI